MTLPPGYHEIADLVFDDGRALVGARDDRKAVYIEAAGEFSARDAMRVRDEVAFAVDVLPEMYSAARRREDPDAAIARRRAA